MQSDLLVIISRHRTHLSEFYRFVFVFVSSTYVLFIVFSVFMWSGGGGGGAGLAVVLTTAGGMEGQQQQAS